MWGVREGEELWFLTGAVGRMELPLTETTVSGRFCGERSDEF